MWVGVLFIDVGAAWEAEHKTIAINNVPYSQPSGFRFRFPEDKFPFRRGDALGNLGGRFDQFFLGYGVGSRMGIGFILLRFDVAWSYDGEGSSSPKYYFSLGADF